MSVDPAHVKRSRSRSRSPRVSSAAGRRHADDFSTPWRPTARRTGFCDPPQKTTRAVAPPNYVLPHGASNYARRLFLAAHQQLASLPPTPTTAHQTTPAPSTIASEWKRSADEALHDSRKYCTLDSAAAATGASALSASAPSRAVSAGSSLAAWKREADQALFTSRKYSVLSAATTTPSPSPTTATNPATNPAAPGPSALIRSFTATNPATNPAAATAAGPSALIGSFTPTSRAPPTPDAAKTGSTSHIRALFGTPATAPAPITSPLQLQSPSLSVATTLVSSPPSQASSPSQTEAQSVALSVPSCSSSAVQCIFGVGHGVGYAAAPSTAVERGGSMPVWAERLELQFTALDRLLQIMWARSSVVAFSELKSAVQNVADHREFTESNFLQVCSIYPEMWRVRRTALIDRDGYEHRDIAVELPAGVDVWGFRQSSRARAAEWADRLIRHLQTNQGPVQPLFLTPCAAPMTTTGTALAVLAVEDVEDRKTESVTRANVNMVAVAEMIAAGVREETIAKLLSVHHAEPLPPLTPVTEINTADKMIQFLCRINGVMSLAQLEAALADKAGKQHKTTGLAKIVQFDASLAIGCIMLKATSVLSTPIVHLSKSRLPKLIEALQNKWPKHPPTPSTASTL